MREYLAGRDRREAGARSPTSRRASRSCSSRRTRTTARTSSSRSAAPRAARRPTSGPATCSEMYQALRRARTAGRPRCSRASRRTWAGSARSRSWSRATDAWARLKHEAGPHRVQRVPVTESQGRIHTSAATVAVLPEAEEVDVDDRPQRPRDRRVPLERPRRSVGQHHRLGGADHAQADRARRHLPGREEPAPEQGQGAAHPPVPAAAGRAASARPRSCRAPAATR